VLFPIPLALPARIRPPEGRLPLRSGFAQRRVLAFPSAEATSPETEATSPETEATSPETEATSPVTEATSTETEATSTETEWRKRGWGSKLKAGGGTGERNGSTRCLFLAGR